MRVLCLLIFLLLSQSIIAENVSIKIVAESQIDDSVIEHATVEAFYYSHTTDEKGVVSLGSLRDGEKISSHRTNNQGMVLISISSRYERDFVFFKISHPKMEASAITLIELGSEALLEFKAKLRPLELTEKESQIIDGKFLQWKFENEEAKRMHLESLYPDNIEIAEKKNIDAVIFFEGNRLSTKSITSSDIRHISEGKYPHPSQAIKCDPIFYKGDIINAKSNDSERFISGIQSPYDPELWIYSTIENTNERSKLNIYHKSAKRTETIQAQNLEHPSLTLVPLAWSENENEIFVEAHNYLKNRENLGVYKLNIETEELQRIRIPDHYSSSPLLSVDRKFFYYTSSTNEDRDLIHGLQNRIMQFDIDLETESLFYESSGQLRIMGFTDSSIEFQPIEVSAFYSNYAKSSMVAYYLPFDNSQNWCVTRDGTPRPPVSSLTNNYTCYFSYNQHGYEAIDFSNFPITNATLNENIRAVADGTVIFAGYSNCVGSNCGYGNLVKIQHSDGNISYYAHLASLNVNNGDCVVQGQIIGSEGATGDECCSDTYGEHTHFEIRASDASGTQIWIPFAEYGETPRQNDYVSSGNTSGTCNSSPPQGGSSCSATAPVNVHVTNLINGYNGSTNGGGFTGNINFNDYVAGVVEGEIGGITTNSDVKKAQAIAARTFSLFKHLQGSYSVNIGQAYNGNYGLSSANSSINTDQEVLLYNGSVADARYSARCNGDYTQHSTEGTWSPYTTCSTSGSYYAYLTSVACSGHSNCDNISGESPCCGATNSTTGAWGYIYGHGVGMCQRGIEQYGEIYGWAYCSILEHYYPGICVANASCSGSGGPSGLICSGAVNLSCGSTYTGSYSSASSNVSSYSCNSWTETGPERVHTFVPTVNGTFSATISNFTGDLDVYILGSCDPSNCLGTVTSTSATYANGIAGQTYYIVVDADDGSGSGYDLLVTDGACSSGGSTNCEFTIYNNTDCTIFMEWWTGSNWTIGSYIGPNSSGSDFIGDGWMMNPLNTADGQPLFSSITAAYCSIGYAVIDATACSSSSSGGSSCNFTIYNNTDCELELQWNDGVSSTLGSIILPYGSATQTIGDGDIWVATNTADGSVVTPTWNTANCAVGYASVDASACSGSPASTSCYFTIYNNTDCNVNIEWWTGTNWTAGSYIAANSFATDYIGDGYFWNAINAADGSSLFTYIPAAYCSDGSGTIDAIACSSGPPAGNTCNFTIYNNTDCELELQWNDGISTILGATIQPFGYVTEAISDGDIWVATNTADGSVVTPTWNTANCSVGYASVDASACSAGSTGGNTCNFTIYNNTDCDLQLEWNDGVSTSVGFIVFAYGFVSQSINDGDLWVAYDAVDGTIVTPSWNIANCSSGSATIDASACSSGPPAGNSCSYTIYNNTDCDIYLEWYDGTSISTGSIIFANGFITENIDDGDMWVAYDAVTNALLTPNWIAADCAVGSGSLAASACSSAPPPGTSCGFTIYNNTDCDIYLEWYDGTSITSGSIIFANGFVTESIDDGDMWVAYDAVTNALLTPNWITANCAVGSGTLSASACSSAPPPSTTCNFTIYNNTDCDIYLEWYDGTSITSGSIIFANGFITESIDDGDMWVAYDAVTSVLLTPNWIAADCAVGSGSLAASACSSAPPPNTTCNFTIYNNTDCDIYLEWYDGTSITSGSIIFANGFVTESIDDGDMWVAFDAVTSALLTPNWITADCAVGSGSLAASTCYSAPPPNTTCYYTIYNNTGCDIYLEWYDGTSISTGSIIFANGFITESIDDGDMWVAYDAVTSALLTPNWVTVDCAVGSGSLAASACSSAPPPGTSCNFTIYNNTGCDIYLEWYDGTSISSGSIIFANGFIIQSIDDGDMWVAYDAVTNALLTPNWITADCAVGSGSLAASACSTATPPGTNCNFTIYNNTDCDIYLEWYDGTSITSGSIIFANGFINESIDDGDMWVAYDAVTNALLTPNWIAADCAIGSGSLAASACSSGSPSTGCNFTIFNNSNCNIYLYWYDGVNFYQGISIQANSFGTEIINDGYMWAAFNEYDGTLVSSNYASAYCSDISVSINASACGSSNACSDIYQDGMISSSMTIEAPNYIISPSTGNTCQVSSSAVNVLFDSGGYIELGIGFEVELGAEFTALIDGCDGNFREANLSKESWSFSYDDADSTMKLRLFNIHDESINLSLKDMFGDKMEDLILTRKVEGTDEYIYALKTISTSGFYFLTLESDKRNETKPLIINNTALKTH